MHRSLLAGLALLLVFAAPAAASGSGESIYATGVAGQCVPPVPPPPGSLLQQCNGSAVLTGGWTGTLRFHARGKVRVVSGDASGTISELFTGRVPGRGRGTILMRGTFVVDGATGEARSVLTIEHGTGAFARCRGSVTVTGTMPITSGPSVFSVEGTWWPEG
jgi:hypothetical protein